MVDGRAACIHAAQIVTILTAFVTGRYIESRLAGRSFNGRTADSGSAYRGSNPCLPANNLLVALGLTLCYLLSTYAGV